MKALTRLLQALAILGAVASAAFYFLGQMQFQSMDTDLQSLNRQITQARKKIGDYEKQLREQDEQLADRETEAEKLVADNLLANNQLLQLQRENKRLADEREAQTISERRLQQENSRLSQELNVLKATSVPQDTVAAYELTIANLEREVLELQQTKVNTPVIGSAQLPSRLPEKPSLSGSVLQVGKGASFVVLDIGYQNGVRLQNELYIQHADTPIAKIQVTEVKENLSIARILPESLLKTPQIGDSVSSLN